MNSSLKLNQSAGTGTECDLSYGGTAGCSRGGGMVRPNGGDLQGLGICVTRPAVLSLIAIHMNDTHDRNSVLVYESAI